MRNLLNNLYRLGGLLSALHLTAIMLLIVLQVLGRVLDKLLLWVGFNPLGLHLPGLAEISAFLLLGATFFGLAYTFWQGGHIRVTLIIQRLPLGLQRWLDSLMLLIAMAITGFALGFSVLLALDSYAYGDLSIGMVPVPLWIPQVGMSLGLLWLFIALTDALFSLLSGRITQLNTDAAQE
ncbi:TRAP transporter small permease [Marinospirillum insulare]|uniref:TRAP transporter small permease protein n=1 Tax=Marinospirillum insulare TaxID=217169 RepID=A0ABQ5ZWV4_9GAMM|nr:TRAP transporter small permease [Marinospirillum insulare]GLR63553.1 C4-dicarboxylate ABC transporter substrate-binding protein [Marinospirillum insulare]